MYFVITAHVLKGSIFNGNISWKCIEMRNTDQMLETKIEHWKPARVFGKLSVYNVQNNE